MWRRAIVLTILYCVSFGDGAKQFELKFTRSPNKVIVTDYYYMLELAVVRDDRKIQSVTLGTGAGGFITARSTVRGFVLSGRGADIEVAREVDEDTYSQISVSRKNIRKSVNDCVNLHSSAAVNWYGGNQQRWQYYPIQRMTHKHNSYVTKESQNQAIAERYWLNSNGIFIRVDNDAPLFLDQNNQHPGFMCMEAKRALPYDIYHTTFDFTYHVGIGLNAREAHRQAIARFLGKPSGHPDEMMVKQPVWSTWAKFKRNINTVKVMDFAQKIVDNGFNGQFEIDDDWEECYGALKFNTQKFSNIKQLTDQLKQMGFRVTLWIHPFINTECVAYFEDAKSNNRFVTDHRGNILTSWWNSGINTAAYIDFTKPDVAKWYSDRLQLLRDNDGIDSFKFDAGESSWVPPDPVLNGNGKEHPSKITTDYVRTVAKFGSLVEVRSGHGTQDLPIFVRMIDKDTEWMMNNGLPTLITTLLQLNLAGYPLVLPDMIGGNGYGDNGLAPPGTPEGDDDQYKDNRPSMEIFLRWLQANTFMPCLQFSYVPWDYEDPDAVAISHKFVGLHEQYTPYIMERFKLAVSKGEPVNPPIWWIAPEDKVAQTIDDEFLLGDKILTAPVVKEGATSRDVYLPAGTWTDGNNGQVYRTNSGMWIRNYYAPLHILPYFIKS